MRDTTSYSFSFMLMSARVCRHIELGLSGRVLQGTQDSGSEVFSAMQQSYLRGSEIPVPPLKHFAPLQCLCINSNESQRQHVLKRNTEENDIALMSIACARDPWLSK